MAQLINTPFWYFYKNEGIGYTLELRGLISTPIQTSITLDKVTRLNAEFCSELEIELIHALKPIASDLTKDNESANSNLLFYAYIAQALGATRYAPPLILDARDHFNHIVLGELYIGDVIEVDINKVDIKLFITGIFDDSLQAVVLNDMGTTVFKPFQNLYVRDI